MLNAAKNMGNPRIAIPGRERFFERLGFRVIQSRAMEGEGHDND